MVELFQLWVLAGQKRGLESAFEEMISRAKSSTTSGWGTRPRRCQWRTLVCIGNCPLFCGGAVNGRRFHRSARSTCSELLQDSGGIGGRIGFTTL